MSRIFGYVVGAIWIVFVLMAVRAAQAGAAAGQPDTQFWYLAIAFFLAIAAAVAIVGTLRYRPTGPKK